MALNISVLATVILLLPTFYLLLASPAFLVVRLDIPQVAYLFRAMFFGYFLVLLATGLVSATLNTLDGRFVPAVLIAAFTALALVWRHWMMQRLDARLAEVQAGVEGVSPRLRRLHWLGMAANAAQAGTIIALIPELVVV